MAGAYALRLKVITSLWPVAFAMRCKVVLDGLLPPFSSRAIFAWAVLSLAASWGSGSSRANLYGSVLYAMFCRQILGFARGSSYVITQ